MRLPSGEVRKIRIECKATIGEVGNIEHGNINIGNNVLIAPGAYVNFDVPDGSIVIGNPGLIRRSPGATLNYINNTILFDEYNVRSDGVRQW